VLERAVKRLDAHLLDHRVVGEAGVVDQDVDPACAVEHLLDQVVTLPGVFEIGGHTDRRAAGLLDEFDRLADGAGQRGSVAAPDRRRRRVGPRGHHDRGALGS